MAIVELGERVWMLPGGVNIGILRGEGNRFVLIDTGLHETSAKRAIKAVREELGGEVGAIVTTHAHADHFGGNATVVKRAGARVWAPAVDEAILRYPLIQPALLYAGADPPRSMRGSYLLAEPSPVDHIITTDRIDVEGVELEVIPLGGHSPNQLGFLIDGVLFSADVVLPESVLEKYRIPYLFSVTDHLNALEQVATVDCRSVVPGHGPLLESVEPLRDLNRSLVVDVADRIVELCARPIGAEPLMEQLLQVYEAKIDDVPGYYLLQPAVYAFLSYLTDTGRLVHHVANGTSRWVAT